MKFAALLVTALAGCTTTRPVNVLTDDKTPLSLDTDPHTYTLPTGEAIECATSYQDACGWHLHGCGEDRTEDFDCLMNVWKQGS